MLNAVSRTGSKKVVQHAEKAEENHESVGGQAQFR
jgi:hypothetical protein